MRTVGTAKGFYNIPEEVLDDIHLYRAEVERFLNGEVSQDRFKPFRVSRGIYAQRGQKTYMIRIKVPAGGLTPEQMERIADLSEVYGNAIPHVTSRQDLQIHWVKLEDTIKVMEGLAEAGLTTRGGGGNTVRNITACPDSGVCDKEAFDVAPFAIAMTEYFLNHPKSLTLPRKFKIAFSGCSDDCALSTINDVGFIAKRKTINGKEEEGFSVYVAGGMGAYSRVADLLEEFIAKEEVLHVTESIINLFDKHGNRRNKHKARLRFVIDKYGYDEFKRLYQKERESLKGRTKALNIRSIPFLRSIDKEHTTLEGTNELSTEYKDWFQTNVRKQKQDGFYYAKIRLPIGDIPSSKLKGLAVIVKGYGEGSIRTTHDQNIIIRWLKREDLPGLYRDLKKLGLDQKDAGGIEDVVCCPGAATCNLGICLSRNMATVLSKELEESGLPLTKLQAIDIKISGCPNSCGQHPIGMIGFHGAARRGNGRMAPHYEVLLGGRVEEGKTRLSRPCGFVPAKNIPPLVKEFLALYLRERLKEEDFYTFLDRRGYNDIKNIIKSYSSLPGYEGNRDYYIDWGAKEEFSLAGLGPGECGAGVFDMIETDMTEAREHLNRAKGNLECEQDPSEALYKALLLTAKSLLITQGIEPTSDLEAFKAFEESFVKKGYIPEHFLGLQKKGAQFLSGLLDREGFKKGLDFVDQLLTRVTMLYESMDDSLRFKVEVGKKEGHEKEKEVKKKGDADVFMDLRGVKCPINYVKAKIRLEEMEEGQTLLLYLDDGEPIRNVPSSLKNDGQEILKMEKAGEYFELLVKKVV